jgi:alpha-mannosidase
LGKHRLRYALFPHHGDWRAAGTVARATAFARPLLMAAGEPDAILKRPLVEASPAGVVIDTIKPAEDGEGFVVRLYESLGAKAAAHLAFSIPIGEAWLSNTLEDRLSPRAIEAGAVALALRPFQIATLRLK